MRPNPPSRYNDTPSANSRVPPPAQMPYMLQRLPRRRPWHLWLLGCAVLLGSLMISTLCGGIVVVNAILSDFGEQV
ncbi:MAG: hypothetical protein CUN49_09555, partial [Candidatus Thermofonsia Clade 1 bacterium]